MRANAASSCSTIAAAQRWRISRSESLWVSANPTSAESVASRACVANSSAARFCSEMSRRYAENITGPAPAMRTIASSMGNSCPSAWSAGTSIRCPSTGPSPVAK